MIDRLLALFPAPEGRRVPVAERRLLAAMFASLAILRLIYIFHYRIDTDEHQHLHTAWGWSRGLVQYRDVFDNHVPLFHLLMAPVVAAFGERPDIVILMRLVMLSTYAGSLFGTFLLGRALFGARAGLWAAALLGSQNIFFFRSVEFRTDDLWVTLLVFSLFALLGGPASAKRFFVAGLVLGTALSVSFKSPMMILSICGAGLLLPALSPEARQGLTPARAARLAAAFFGGLAIVPLLVILFIWSIGVWDSFVYCVYTHNIVRGGAHPRQSRISRRHLLSLPLMAILAVWAARISRVRGAEGGGARAAALLLVVGFYNILLKLVWPVVETQTMLSFYPLVALGTIAAPFGWAKGGEGKSSGPAPRWLPSTPIVASMILLAMARLPMFAPLMRNDASRLTEQIAAVLKLTDRDDYVLDPNGEAVFRRRPYYYLLEKFTGERLLAGALADDLPASCLEKKTLVIIDEGDKYNFTSRRFLDQTYIKVGRVSVAGKILRRQAWTAGQPIPFTLLMPAEYDLISERGKLAGTLDGTPYDAPRALEAGPHVFIPAEGGERMALIWSRAFARGFAPFKIAAR